MDKKRILLVGAEEALQRTLRMALEIQGYSVQLAADSAQALAETTTRQPDLILVDISDPALDAVGFSRELFRLRVRPTTPLVVLSAKGRRKREVELMVPDRHLERPVDVGALIRVVSDLMLRDRPGGDP